MKKFHIFAASLAMMFGMTSCDLFEMDNYDAPEETIQGEVVDVLTGEPEAPVRHPLFSFSIPAIQHPLPVSPDMIPYARGYA